MSNQISTAPVFTNQISAVSVQVTIQSNDTVHVDIQDHEIDRDDILEKAYEVVGCNTVDIVRTNLAGHNCSIWVDDNGRISSDEPSVIGFVVIDDHGNKIPLAGNLLITGDADENGETTACPLTNLELAEIMEPTPDENGTILTAILPAMIGTL